MDKYVVSKLDVGKNCGVPVKTVCSKCGHITFDYPFEPLGRVQECDVGKLCKKINDIWYVENDEQFRKRKSEQSFYISKHHTMEVK